MRNIFKVLLLVSALIALPFTVTSQDTQDSNKYALVLNDEEPISVSFENYAKLDKEFEPKKEKQVTNTFVFYETHIVHIDKRGKEHPYKVLNFDMILTPSGFMYRVHTEYKGKNYIIGIEAASFGYMLLYEYDVKKEKVKSAKVFY